MGRNQKSFSENTLLSVPSLHGETSGIYKLIIIKLSEVSLCKVFITKDFQYLT
jgi:hypothetical protein